MNAMQQYYLEECQYKNIFTTVAHISKINVILFQKH